MADRYCRNCGRELGTEDRFCANGGRAVHETAHVPTPETDRPVPPSPVPQQSGGASSSGRLTTPQLLVGGAGVVLVLLLLVVGVALLGSGGRQAEGGQPANQGADSPVEEPEAANEEPAQPVSATPPSSASASASASALALPVPNTDCSIGEACELGTGNDLTINDVRTTNVLTSDLWGAKQGHFVVVDYTYTYNGRQAVTMEDYPWLVMDDQERTYQYDFDSTNEYVNDPRAGVYAEFQPGIPKKGRVIFPLAPDSKNISLHITDPVLPQNSDVALVEP